MSKIDVGAVVWLAGINATAFIAFGLDKRQAKRGEWRASEWFLVKLGIFGGWPGGLLGMITFRHKVAKLSFKIKYALALVPFAAEIWAWLHWR